MTKKTTGLILTYNGERLLEKCLRSLDFCDELLVVDSQSTDRTREIAEACGARVIVNPWDGPLKQFRFAFSHITTPWIVSLDQDEWLSPELRADVMAALEKDEPLAGYWVSRSSWYHDRFMKHSGWYPDRLLRVFRPDRMELSANGPHYRFSPKGETRLLSGDILHMPYVSFHDHMARINRYAQVGAEDLRRKGRKGGLLRALLHASARFVKTYLLKLGLLDGKAGFINALVSFIYVFQKYIRVEEKTPWGEER